MMLTLPKDTNMGSPLLHEIKKQASSFLKENIRTARLVLTDVTPVQLMTEEATNANPWPLETHTLGVISRAAFEVDDYWRIVETLHKRLSKFDGRIWRASYKALILLEHLLTHGPHRVFEEFQSDKDVIKQIEQFQYIDERGFNWGLSVRKLSERILMLLENEDFLKEERVRARQLSRGIEGFGSFSPKASVTDGSLEDPPSKIYGRCHSYSDGYDSKSSGTKFNFADGNIKRLHHKSMHSEVLKQENNSKSGDGRNIEDDHPFVEKEKLATASLLTT